MPQEIVTENYLTFTIPSILDPVDIPQTFRDYVDSILSPTVKSNDSSPLVISESHINTVFSYADSADVTIKAGLPKGFQFSIYSETGTVTVSASANATDVILPVNTIGPNKVATFTKIKEGAESMWLMGVSA
jgi:hypothetical protein